MTAVAQVLQAANDDCGGKVFHYLAPAEALQLLGLSNLNGKNLTRTWGSTKLPVGEAFHQLEKKE